MKRMEASKGGTKVGRMKDPLYKDSYLGINPLPSSYLSRPLRSGWLSAGTRPNQAWGPGLRLQGFRVSDLRFRIQGFGPRI